MTTRLPSALASVALIVIGLVAAAPATAAAPGVSRLAGADRYETSVAVSGAYDPGVPVVYVATGQGFADALSAAPAAAHSGGPLLLTDPNTLPTTVRAEIARLEPAEIVVVGGEGAVSRRVYSSLSSLAPSIRRDAGASRYETAEVVVERAFSGGAATAFVATGANFPDALSASAAAGELAAPVVLVAGNTASTESRTTSLLQKLGVTKVFIAGGPGVVSEGIERGLRSRVSVERLAGADRYSTSVAINAAVFDEPEVAYFAVGTGFADALSGAALAGSVGAPLFVSPATCVPTGTLSTMARWQTSSRVLLGGPGALGPGVEKKTPCADGGTIAGDGDFRTGKSINAGTYYAPAAGTDGCYWERVSSFDGDLDSLIANDYGYGQRIVTIESSDYGFTTSRCGRWYPIAAAPKLSKIPADGVFVVGQQIDPGEYRTSSSSGSCYWERLSGFSGEFEDILANDFTDSPSIVTIRSSDVGFATRNCGAWTKIG